MSDAIHMRLRLRPMYGIHPCTEYRQAQSDLMHALRQQTGDEPVFVALDPLISVDYQLWCLGHNLTIAGAMEEAFRWGNGWEGGSGPGWDYRRDRG